MFLQKLIDDCEEEGKTKITLSVAELENLRDAEDDSKKRLWGIIESWLPLVFKCVKKPDEKQFREMCQEFDYGKKQQITRLREEFLSTKRPKKRTRCLKMIKELTEF